MLNNNVINKRMMEDGKNVVLQRLCCKGETS